VEGNNGTGSPIKRGLESSFLQKDMSKVQCYYCKEYGHYARDCPKLKKGGKATAGIVGVQLVKEDESEDEEDVGGGVFGRRRNYLPFSG